MGIAVGEVGMTLQEFFELSPQQFSSIYKSYSEKTQRQARQQWEIARWHAAIILSPNAKKGHTITPKDICVFDWERPKAEKIKMTKEEQRERMKRLAESLGDKMI